MIKTINTTRDENDKDEDEDSEDLVEKLTERVSIYTL